MPDKYRERAAELVDDWDHLAFCSLDDLSNRIATLCAQVAEESAPRWIPVTERLPQVKHGIFIVVDENGWVRAEAWRDGLWLNQPSPITHWQPLPPPPQD